MHADFYLPHCNVMSLNVPRQMEKGFVTKHKILASNLSLSSSFERTSQHNTTCKDFHYCRLSY